MSEKMVQVMLHKDNNKNRGDLFVGVNMQDYHIPRGVPYEVTESVAQVIANKLAQEDEVLQIIEQGKKASQG